MGRASATITIPGVRIADAEALWYDLTRWPSFVEGFKHVVRVEGDWPAAGSVLVWDSVPDGRGRVTEAVASYVAARGPGRRRRGPADRRAPGGRRSRRPGRPTIPACA